MISPDLSRRYFKAKLFRGFCFSVAWVGILILGILLFHVTWEGFPWLDMQFINDFPSRFPKKAGINSALFGTLWLIGFTALFSVPIGIGAGIYLEEFGNKNYFSRFVDLNISNLAGVPSIVYGMLGMVIFVRWFGLGESVLAGALTMSLLILPIIIIATREALRAVSGTIRQAAFSLGATRWQTVYAHVLPQIFNWAARPQKEFHELAAAGILVLLFVLLLMNSIAVIIRHRLENKNQ